MNFKYEDFKEKLIKSLELEALNKVKNYAFENDKDYKKMIVDAWTCPLNEIDLWENKSLEYLKKMYNIQKIQISEEEIKREFATNFCSTNKNFLKCEDITILEKAKEIYKNNNGLNIILSSLSTVILKALRDVAMDEADTFIYRKMFNIKNSLGEDFNCYEFEKYKSADCLLISNFGSEENGRYNSTIYREDFIELLENNRARKKTFLGVKDFNILLKKYENDADMIDLIKSAKIIRV